MAKTEKWFYSGLLGGAVIFAAIGLNIQALMIGFCAILGLLLYHLRKP